MTYYDMRTPARKLLPAVVAGAALVLAGAFSIGGVHLFGNHFGFGFVPLLILSIWPRFANTLVSVFLVFGAGLFTDWATGGIVGQWALIFSIIWGVFRPELRGSPFSPLSIVLFWIATCGVAVILLFISGWFVFGVHPDWMSLGRQIIAATLLLPIILIFRHVIASRLGDNEVWGG